MPQTTAGLRLFLVSLDPSIADMVMKMPLRGASDWVRCSTLDELVGALESEAQATGPALAVIACKDSQTLDSADLRRALHAGRPVRLAVATKELIAGEERRLIFAGATCVLQPPLPQMGVDALARDQRYLEVLFQGVLDGRRSERHQLRVPSARDNIQPLIRFFCQRMDALGYPGDLVRSNLPLVLDEAVTNAMEHGNGWDASKEVSIDADLRENGFTLKITDQGKGFTRQRVESPLEEKNLTRIGGRGLFLMEQLMDSVEYTDGGRTIVLKKSIGRGAPLPA